MQSVALLQMETESWMKSFACTTIPWSARSASLDIVSCLQIDVDPDCRYSVFVSFVEIYNEQVFDLLEPSEKKGLGPWWFVSLYPEIPPRLDQLCLGEASGTQAAERT